MKHTSELFKERRRQNNYVSLDLNHAGRGEPIFGNQLDDELIENPEIVIHRCLLILYREAHHSIYPGETNSI